MSWIYTNPDNDEQITIYETDDGQGAILEPRFDGDPEPYWDNGGTGNRYRPDQVR
ncbi:hypothetical protein [Amycolatopsis sp. NPDC004079]|uniref:hypothetical protein n=1 Tax=Amycolatopsis sp. NPDC004079 TaxID=3154549 RepID=UPI0033B056EF